MSIVSRSVSTFAILSLFVLSGCATVEPTIPIPPELPSEPTATGDFSTGFTDGYRTGFYDGLAGVTYNNRYPPVDTDGDGMHDNYEVHFGLNPNDPSDANADADGDLAINVDEYFAATSIIEADTDKDGLPDGFEIAYGLNALNGNDSLIDSDGDGVSNMGEYVDGTDPSDPESFIEKGPLQAGDPGLLLEYWDNIPGRRVTDLTANAAFDAPPTSVKVLSEFRAPINRGENYGARISGFLSPPTSGPYQFKLASDDYGELWLSTDESKENKQLIAHVNGWTRDRVFTKYPEQTSSFIQLEAGRHYYIEALFKEANGGDNLTVEWNGPDLITSAIGIASISQITEESVGSPAPLPDTGPELPTTPAPEPVENSGATAGPGSTSTVEASGSYTILGDGSGIATISWNIPSQRVDGSPLELYDISGYEVSIIRLDGGTTTLTIDDNTKSDHNINGLVSGTYNISIKTIDSEGVFSEPSPMVTKQVP